MVAIVALFQQRNGIFSSNIWNFVRGTFSTREYAKNNFFCAQTEPIPERQIFNSFVRWSQKMEMAAWESLHFEYKSGI